MSTTNHMNVLVILTRAPTPSNGKNIENNGKNPLFSIFAVFWGVLHFLGWFSMSISKKEYGMICDVI